jgi:hypothetical protein
MGWRDQLNKSSGEVIAPWLGGAKVFRDTRQWRLDSDKLEAGSPAEIGWYRWTINGRKVCSPQPVDPDADYGESWQTARGYLIGDRFVASSARVTPELDKLIEQTQRVFLAEPGLERFTPVEVVIDPLERAIFKQELFAETAEESARHAFVDRKASLDDVAEVSPALDLAFRFLTWRRDVAERRRADAERRRQEAEHQRQQEELLAAMIREEAEQQQREEQELEEMVRACSLQGSAVGRRQLASNDDLNGAAAAALALSGARLLDVRRSHQPDEAIVQFRFMQQRFECVIDRCTLQIIDSGICLTDETTGERGDSYLSLESLPGVIREAINDGVLVVYRHC